MIYSTKVNKIISHFHITQKYFYKYLQIRHYVSIRNGGLSIGNYYNFLYNFFLCSSDTQKFVSKFYSMLVEHRQKSWRNLDLQKTDLQKSWSKKNGYDFDAASWENIIKLPVSISVCNEFREMQFYIVHQAYVSPYRYSKFNKQVSPNCMKCKKIPLHFVSLSVGM